MLGKCLKTVVSQVWNVVRKGDLQGLECVAVKFGDIWLIDNAWIEMNNLKMIEYGLAYRTWV